MTDGSTNLLLSDDESLSDIDLSAWREKVRKDGSAFIDLCVETGLCPDVWSLYEWSNWLTPISVGHKRFDTMFYICCLEKQPKVVLDYTEVTTLKVRFFFPLEFFFSSIFSFSSLFHFHLYFIFEVVHIFGNVGRTYSRKGVFSTSTSV